MKIRRDTADSERGMAVLLAVVCILVVLTLTTVAIEQSVGSLSSFAQGRKLLQTVDAAETGIQGEITAMEQWLSSPTLTIPCAGGSAVQGLPSGQGWTTAGASSADSVANNANLGYYSLSVATYTSEPTGSPAALPGSDACYGHTVLAPVTTPWYLIVQSQGITSATTGGSTATGRTLQALLRVNEGTLASHNRPGGQHRASGQIELVAFYTGSPTTYTSTATAQAVSFNPVSTNPTTASYSGYGPPDPKVVQSTQPPATPFTTESWLTLGALSQYAEADSSGASVACSGLVASPGTIGLGDPTCSPTGSPLPDGVKLDLSTIPSVGTVLSSIADVSIETSAITSAASMGTNGSSFSGSASFGALYVQVTLPLGSPITIPVTVSTAPNQDLLTEVTDAISGDASAIGPITSTLVSTLQSTFTMTSNYQAIATSGSYAGGFVVSAVHLKIPAAGVTADLAMSVAGPNTTGSGSAPPPPTNSLSVVWIKQVP